MKKEEEMTLRAYKAFKKKEEKRREEGAKKSLNHLKSAFQAAPGIMKAVYTAIAVLVMLNIASIIYAMAIIAAIAVAAYGIFVVGKKSATRKEYYLSRDGEIVNKKDRRRA